MPLKCNNMHARLCVYVGGGGGSFSQISVMEGIKAEG